ncbi:MAG: glycoside hydrolase family 127 protein [Phycisphaerae bacterium]|nr:glycoside hydrolase family 127 protein [Phycisphaerae bacterium]
MVHAATVSEPLDSMKVTVVSKPATGAEDSAYLTHRPPLSTHPMIKLPLGAVRPAGWLKHQLDLMAGGMVGRLPEISKDLAPDNGWFGGENDGWEEQPYWFRGFYSLARLTGDSRLLAEADRWIEAVLNSQQADGYFGAAAQKKCVGDNGQEMCDLWPHMIMLDAVIRHYEATSDERVIPFMTRFFAFCRDMPDDQFVPSCREGWGKNWHPHIQRVRAGDMLPHLYWLFNQTGEEWLLTLATRFYRRITKPTDEWLDHHVIHFTQRFGYPGVYSTQTNDPRHLALSEYWYHQHLGTWGQQPRGIFGADEKITTGRVDPRQAFETCGFGEFAKNFYLLGRLTGNAMYADRVEDLLFNHFPASHTPDWKGLHYLTAANQPQLDASESHEYWNKGHMIDYSPWLYRCCRHNVAMTWPWLVENLWQATADGGLAAWMYSACDVTARIAGGKTVKISEETDYPFRGGVKLTVSCDSPITFPLYLRIPRWCNGFGVRINRQSLETEGIPGQYLRIERTWAKGDVVEIDMAMSLSLTTWPRTGSVTVDRGPLSYSVKIGEKWRTCGGTDDWPEWEVLPTTPWNYGLVLDGENPLKDFKVLEKGQVADQPWTPDAAPIEITATAKRIPNWTLVNETVDELQESPIRSAEPEETVTMIPLGCARLRMSCLPVIRDVPHAQEWKSSAKT